MNPGIAGNAAQGAQEKGLNMSAIRKILSLKVRKVPRVQVTLPGILATAAAVCLALTVATGTASASAVGAQPSFAAQARGSELSSAQAGRLQQEVNTYIAQHGGKQIAINEVAFRGGRIVFAMPGQKYAYPVTTARANIDTGPGEVCPVGAFCTFASANFEGSESEFYSCNTWFTNNYNGSWKNDQTSGIKATLRIYNTDTHKYGTDVTCAAYCNDAHWTSGVVIYQVDPC